MNHHGKKIIMIIVNTMKNKKSVLTDSVMCPAIGSLRKHFRLHKVFYNTADFYCICFMYYTNLLSIKSCILTVCYDHLIDSIITDTHNILFYGLILKIDNFIPTPDFPNFYYM